MAKDIKKDVTLPKIRTVTPVLFLYAAKGFDSP